MEELEKVKTILLSLVKAIVSDPDAVEIYTSEGSDEKGEFTKINIKVAKEDIPTAIGARGTTAEAVRRIAILTGKQAGYPKPLFIRVDAPRLPSQHFYNDKEST